MAQLTTLKNGKEARLKPRKETIDFLLNYSRSLEIIELRDGNQMEMIKN
jgi:hypothetical protein